MTDPRCPVCGSDISQEVRATLDETVKVLQQVRSANSPGIKRRGLASQSIERRREIARQGAKAATAARARKAAERAQLPKPPKLRQPYHSQKPAPVIRQHDTAPPPAKAPEITWAVRYHYPSQPEQYREWTHTGANLTMALVVTHFEEYFGELSVNRPVIEAVYQRPDPKQKY